jgi:hypothetical protein
VSVEKYDIKRAYRELYAPSAKEFSLVDVPPMHAIGIDGHGDPNTSPDYAAAVEALYAHSYAIKFASKKELGRDFVVAPLEGLWRADDPEVFVTREKGEWSWTMLIVQPDWITPEMIELARATATKKKALPALEKGRLLQLDEGRCVQIMHIGSYDDEGPTLARLHHEFMPAHGLTFAGDHHEIYLSDPRKSDPAKLKTVLRQPVKPLRN